jgi:phosphoribosylamine---glycine ligase
VKADRLVVVVGQGGREHALALCLLQAEAVREVVVVPGNAGIQAWKESGLLPGKSLRAVAGDPVEVALSLGADLVVVGPEQPLSDGLVDKLAARGITAYGPLQAAAALEGSKAFMKECATEWGIPTADYRVVSSLGELDAALAAFEAPPVVKADGLCAGKGVVVAESHAQARTAAQAMLSGEAFGAAGRRIVLEERLLGVEVSAHAVCDGERALILPFVQDHKRLLDADRGPNTGGMGTYGPVTLPTADLEGFIEQRIVAPVLDGMRARGTPFRGTLFANLMLVPGRSPMLLEINTRFGDPETQILTRVTAGDWYTLLHGAACGRGLQPADFPPAKRHALCVILAAPGYPDAPRTGQTITGLSQAGAREGVQVFHAGTVRSGEEIRVAGGRVLGVCAEGSDLVQAQARAYEAAGCIHFDGVQYRRDIGYQALNGGAGSTASKEDK